MGARRLTELVITGSVVQNNIRPKKNNSMWRVPAVCTIGSVDESLLFSATWYPEFVALIEMSLKHFPDQSRRRIKHPAGWTGHYYISCPFPSPTAYFISQLRIPRSTLSSPQSSPVSELAPLLCLPPPLWPAGFSRCRPPPFIRSGGAGACTGPCDGACDGACTGACAGEGAGLWKSSARIRPVIGTMEAWFSRASNRRCPR